MTLQPHVARRAIDFTRRRLTSVPSQTWFIAVCLLGSWSIFLWCSNRGFEFRDEAYQLIWADSAFSYKVSLTDFAYILHPLYWAVRGDIALYCQAGLVILTLCGLLFGHALARFIAPRFHSIENRSFILISVATGVFWEFVFWRPVPNYNELSLCALLLIFSGLLVASADSDEPHTVRALFETKIGPAVLVGLGLAIAALNKPTTSALAFVLSLVWVAFVRPRRLILCLLISAASAIAAMAVVIFIVDGSIGAFVYRKLEALTLLLARSDQANVHGLMDSLVGPFSPDRRWKILPVAASSSVLFLICAASFFAALRPFAKIRDSSRRLLIWAAPIVLGVLVAAWRMQDGGAVVVPALHAWQFSLLMNLIALTAVLSWLAMINLNDWHSRRVVGVAALLALAPICYSFGTDNVVILHMTAASVFWVGSASVLTILLPTGSAKVVLRTIAANVGAATLGFLIGVIVAPGQLGHPMWHEDVPVAFGPHDAALMVDEPTAEFIGMMRQAANSNGFVRGTPILDLSGVGPGLIYALNGTAPGVPWLIYNADDTGAASLDLLRTLPKSVLERSWILTVRGGDLQNYGLRLRPLGLNFPSGYMFVGQARRRDFGWGQTLWKPRSSRP